MTHRSYGRWYLRHGPVYCIGHARCIGRLTRHACPSTRTPAARQRPRGGVGSCRDPGPARLPAGRAIRHRRRDHDARPARDRDQRRGLATGGPRTRHLPDGRGARRRLAPAAAAVDRRRAQPAAGARIADADAVARGRLSVAARAGGDEPVRRFRPRPPAGRRDRPPAAAASGRDRVGGRVHGACRHRVRGRRDRQRARAARPDDTARGLAFRADRHRGRAPALRRRPGCRQERPAHRPSRTARSTAGPSARWTCPASGSATNFRWLAYVATDRELGQYGAASFGGRAWTRTPGGGWAAADAQSVREETLDLQAVRTALARRSRATAEDRGIEVIEGARARRCRVAVDGATFRAAFPQIRWLVGDADLERWRGQLDYWVFARRPARPGRGQRQR